MQPRLGLPANITNKQPFPIRIILKIFINSTDNFRPLKVVAMIALKLKAAEIINY